ncbi:hypothetical protein ACFL1U_02550 [Patescibacteria group bacterium]
MGLFATGNKLNIKSTKRLKTQILRRPALQFIKDIYKKYPEVNVYLVGGAVRDYFLDRKVYDLDFVVTGIKGSVLEKFLARRGDIKKVGRVFGIFKFKPKDIKQAPHYDIALPRTEKSTGPRYQDFKVTSNSQYTIKEDLRRRDFNINAMAVDLKTGELIDPHKGLESLRLGELKTVRDPFKRFREDHTRLLRALRFAVVLDFDFCRKTWDALRELLPNIQSTVRVGDKMLPVVPRETIAREFLKAFHANPVRTITLYRRSGALKFLIPEVLKLEGVEQGYGPGMRAWDAWEQTLHVLSNLPQNAPLELQLAVLFSKTGKVIVREKKSGRTVFPEYQSASAEVFLNTVKKLRMSSTARTSKYWVDQKLIAWLIEQHVLIFRRDVRRLKRSVIFQRLVQNPKRGRLLVRLFIAEATALPYKKKRQRMQLIRVLQWRIKRVTTIARRLDITDKTSLVSGDFIQKELKLDQGPLVGAYLKEAQSFALNYMLRNKQKPNRVRIIRHLKKFKPNTK